MTMYVNTNIIIKELSTQNLAINDGPQIRNLEMSTFICISPNYLKVSAIQEYTVSRKSI